MPKRSKGRGQTKSDPTGPPGWGLGRGLITPSCKKKNYYRNQKQSEFTISKGNCGSTSQERINDAWEPKPAGHLRDDQASLIHPKYAMKIGNKGPMCQET